MNARFGGVLITEVTMLDGVTAHLCFSPLNRWLLLHTVRHPIREVEPMRIKARFAKSCESTNKGPALSAFVEAANRPASV